MRCNKISLALGVLGLAFSQWLSAATLSGLVTHADKALEGVVVTLMRGSTGVITAVSTGANGRYTFPSSHVASGQYLISVRATGFKVEPESIELEGDAQFDIALKAVNDVDVLASQLTSLEWVKSFPGSDDDKDLLIRNMVNCGFCHSLERIARSTHTAEEFLSVIQRMKTYETDHSSALRIQPVAKPEPLSGLQWYGRDAAELAQYLASINRFNETDNGRYPLTTLPRPKGEGTRAIVTVFPIPRQPSVIHDLDVDSKGRVWYGNTGWDFLGRLDPKSGEFSEWSAPNFLPEGSADLPRIVGVQDVQVDYADNVWVGIGGNKHARFVPATERWQIFDLPVIWKNPFLGNVRENETIMWSSGITQVPQGPLRYEHAFPVNVKTGEVGKGIMLFNDFPSPNSPHHKNQLNYCYMFDQDRDGNFLCTASEASAIARADKAGKVRLIKTPTPFAYPRRGYRDEQQRFWFTEFFADRVGRLDLDTDEIVEYPMGDRYISPYYARPDNKGYVWVSSTGSDRLLRLDPRTGDVVQYLMPVSYDARKVVVDEHAELTTIWLPNKNAGQLIRVEIPN